jgi:Dolichyl-phosphate-mannose-protein mannosyltransferase
MERAAEKEHVWRSLVAITVIAFAVRLAFIAVLYRLTYNGIGDHVMFGFEIGRIARSLATGHGFANPLAVPTGPTAWMTPVYPYILAAVFKLFGVYTRASAVVILAFNGLCSALVCVPMYFIAVRRFGHQVAMLACWMWALLPYSIYIASGFVWETCLSALLLAILFFLTMKFKEESAGAWAWLAYGLLWGFAALTNASLLALGPFFTLWAIAPLWRERKKWLTSAAAALLGVLMLLAPWQVRNYRAFHQFIPLRDVFWLQLLVGNDKVTSNWSDESVHPTMSKPALEEFVLLGETGFMQAKREQALDFISAHPAFYAERCLRRVLYMWTSYWNLDPQNLPTELHNPGNVFLTVPFTVLMLIGLAMARRIARSTLAPYLFLFGIYPLIYYLTTAEVRYRHLMDPEILILAALGARVLYVDARRAWKPSA